MLFFLAFCFKHADGSYLRLQKGELATSIFYIQGLISDLKKCLSQNIEGYAAMASKYTLINKHIHKSMTFH